ncbi:divalent metal cation transporter [Candidatus Saccharibacteria bacterium]|jgi:NRAMP (natural resistance-associated macrophage protein)-like metal ion transporter|nr:MAG: divalent metal cation transporter [Candidatus Saccharibacteria bacterium]
MGEILRQYKKTERDVERKVGRAERKTIGVVRGALSRKRFNRFLRVLGPGLVTGAADDDPSGIATYSQAGAGFGTSLLWAFPLMFPLLLAVQESCARIGAISGKGLAAVIKENYNRRLLYAAVFLVVTANVVNIGADLGAMAATTRLFVDLPFELLAVLFAVLTTLLVVFVSYRSYARFLKWLAITLLAYPLTAFMVGQDWGQVLRDTFVVPSISKEALYVFVGMLGTTISPYLFFWDTSEVVEEEIQKHNVAKIGTDTKATKRFIHNLRVDNFVGMALASVTAWFIVIACASTLNRSGITNIATAADAARALEPLVQGFPNAGLIAKLIFSVGIIGLGLLAVPVLAGSSSYAISEALGWKEGLYRKFKRASGFYIVIILATLAGLAMNFIGLDPVKALVFSAVFNGIAAIPLLYIIVRVGSNKRVMGNYKNSWLSNLLIRLAFVVMTLAVLVLMASFVV